MNKTILVTGSNGQLGSELRKLTSGTNNFMFTDVDELDLLNKKKLLEFFKQNKIDYIINCAAYTAVDKAETEPDIACRINVESVHNLVDICNKFNVRLIHISTDFVFDGTKSFPYTESDDTNPLNVYGVTKLMGEEKIVQNLDEYMILRTSWLYSSFGNNFVKTIIRLARKNEFLKVIFDQIGSPTYAKDLAVCIVHIIESGVFKTGIYNYSNEGVAGWYDFAVEICRLMQINCKIIPITAKEYNAAANKPYYSLLNKKKIKEEYDVEIPHWRDSLQKFIEEMGDKL